MNLLGPGLELTLVSSELLVINLLPGSKPGLTPASALIHTYPYIHNALTCLNAPTFLWYWMGFLPKASFSVSICKVPLVGLTIQKHSRCAGPCKKKQALRKQKEKRDCCRKLSNKQKDKAHYTLALYKLLVVTIIITISK